MDEIKRCLKDARVCIEKKEFEEAIKLIKNVLKQDKNNYMGLVLFGVALQDAEQAPLAYRKAIALHKDKPLAWQGLASYFERNNMFSEELIGAYITLSSFENDIPKYQDMFDKIYQACKKINSLSCCILIYEHTLALQLSEKRNISYNTLSKVISNTTLKVDSDTADFLHKVLMLDSDYQHEEDFYENFFKYFTKMRGFDYVLSTYHSYITSHAIKHIIDVILKIYVTNYINDNMFCSNNNTQTNKLVEGLLENNESSHYSPLAETLIMFDQEDFYDAYCKIKGTVINETDVTLLYVYHVIVGNVCLKLGRWLEAEHVSLHHIPNSSIFIQRRLLKVTFVSLCSQKNDEKCRKALELEKNIESDMDKDEAKSLFLALIHLKDYVQAEEKLSVLRDINASEYIPLKCLLLKSVGKQDEGLTVLNKNKETWPLCWLPIAVHHMELEEYDKALLPLLQAAKADKYNSLIFIYLGDYYTLYEDNPEKAKKCYSKAFTLNPECERAGKCLSNTYRNLKNWEANYEFLKQLSSRQNSQNCWTWLELGLHHFALEQWDAAIVNLRTYVRLKVDDVEAWESLADAYYSRGSFTSALKCYQRSIELSPSRKYSVVQIGSVQCLLGDYMEALNTFNSVNNDVFLPALKGLGDVYLAIANDKLSHNLFANCRDNAQRAIYYISKALLSGHQFVCLWNNLSTAVLIIAKLPPKYRWLYIDSKFWNDEEGEHEVKLLNEDLFTLVVQCLCRGIALTTSPNVMTLYYELATVYLDYYKYYGNVSAIQKAYLTMRNCINIERSNWQYWNLFGVICMSKDINKYSLAQHAFLKAVNLEFCNAVVWSNLGVNYLLFGHVVLANKAFQKAQQFDPSFMPSWIGQALVAESVDHSDAMGLFLHSSQLGFHRESSLGYAECVCKNLFGKQLKSISKLEYSMKNMHAIPIACDLMSWLIEYEDSNSFCLNILGILQEKMGLFNSAIKCYKSALELIEPEHKDTVVINYGRILYKAGKYDAALDIFKTMKEEHLSSYCGMALCLNKLDKYQEAYTLYGTAFQWLASDEFERAQLLVALASMAYKNNDIDDCKTLIYQCIEQESSYLCIPVILAGYALSMLTSDKSLYQVMAGNLHKLNSKHQYSHFVALFQSYNLFKNDKTLSAIRELQHFIYIFPHNSSLWRLLSYYCSNDSFAYSMIASASSQKVIAFQDFNINLIQCYRIAGIAEACLGNKSKALKFAQKAIHLNPDQADNWILLIYVYVSNKENLNNKQWMKCIVNFVKSCKTLSKSLKNWIAFFERHSHGLL